MATAYTYQSMNAKKTWLIMTMFFLFVILIGWLFSYVVGDSLILYASVIFAILMNVFSYWYSDKIVIKMSGAKPVKKEDNPDLYNIVENLCIAAGLPMPKLYIVDDPSPNAFATGRNPEHSAVAVTSGLLEILDKTELEGVIAHELSHIKNRDILVSTVAVVLAGFVAIVSDFFIRMIFFNNEKKHPALLILGIIAAILAPIAASLIQLAVSRKREFLADASGALLTRYPEGLANALKKISQYPYGLRNASHATAHLYISDPFKGNDNSITKRISRLFMTHPPVEERIKALNDMNI